MKKRNTITNILVSLNILFRIARIFLSIILAHILYVSFTEYFIQYENLMSVLFFLSLIVVPVLTLILFFIFKMIITIPIKTMSLSSVRIDDVLLSLIYYIVILILSAILVAYSIDISLKIHIMGLAFLEIVWFFSDDKCGIIKPKRTRRLHS